MAAMTREEARRLYENSIKEFDSCLDMDVPSGVFTYLQAPAIVLVSIFIAYLIGVFRFSFILILFMCFTVAHAFKSRMERFKTSFEAMIYERSRRMKAENNWENVEWLNYCTRRLWTVIEPVLSEEILMNVNNFLYENKPPFLNSLKMIEFTLGSIPPKILGVAFYEAVGEEIIQIDAEIAFIPLETPREYFSALFGRSRTEYNSRVCLQAAFGSKKIGIGMPILVKNILFSGKARVIITLGHTPLLIKEVEITLIENPSFNFDLQPLRAVDLMELPGLSNWIRYVINNTLQNQLVNPQSIKIDLETMFTNKKKMLGVFCIQLIEMDTRSNGPHSIELDIDGNRLFTTGEYQGNSIFFNEYFYLKVTNCDDYINFNLRGGSRGNLSIKRLLRDILIEKEEHQGETVMQFDSANNIYMVRLVKDDVVKAILKCGVSFLGLKKTEGMTHLCNKAIFKMNIGRIDDLIPLNKVKKTYTTCCSVVVSPERIEQKAESFWLLNTTANIIGGVIDVFAGAKKEKLLPSTTNTLFVYKTKTVVDSSSPKFNDECFFYSRDINRDIIKIIVVDKEDESSSLMGNVEIPTLSVYNGLSDWFTLKGVQRGKIKLEFGVEHTMGVEYNKNMQYTRMAKIEIIDFSSVFGDGNYTMVLHCFTKCGREKENENDIIAQDQELNHMMVRMDTFCYGLTDINRHVLIPINDTSKIRVDLYKETLRDETFVGTGDFTIEESEKDVLIKNENSEMAKIGLKIGSQKLVPYKGISDDENQIKLVQGNFQNFSKIPEDFRVEYCNREGTVGVTRDAISSSSFCFMMGGEELKAVFKSSIIGREAIIGELSIPKRKYNDSVVLNSNGFSAQLSVDVFTCNFISKPSIQSGLLKIKIVSIKDLKSSDLGLRNVFCKLFINGAQKMKTKIVEKTLNPSFNDEIAVEINRMHDVLRIYVYNWSTFDSETIIGTIETPMYFIDTGAALHKLKLLENNSLVPTGAEMTIATDFNKMTGEKVKRKKNFFDGFLPFE